MDFLACNFYKFLSSELLPTLMQNIGLALVTMLIPLVLFIFSMEKKYLFEWDKIVILDKVLKAKKLIISIGFIFFPIFIWSYDSYLLKFVLFIFFFIGVVFIIEILFNSYRWIKTIEIEGSHDSNNYRNMLRNKYLEDVSNLSEKEKVWSLTWREEIKNTIDEINLIKKFIINIDALFASNSIDFLARFLGTFNAFFEKRALYSAAVFVDLFPKILEWHYIFFKKYNQQKERYEEAFIALFGIESSLTQLVEKCVLSSLGKGTSFLLFKNLKDHSQGKDNDILEELFARSVCFPIFNNVASSNGRYDIWNHWFPQEWKLTKETIEDKENFISEIWLNEFFRWAQERFWYPDKDKDFDQNLGEVSRELFPSVEPILWAKLLTFIMRPWIDDDCMKFIVERRPNFGIGGRIFVSWRSDGETQKKYINERDKQHKDTIELSLVLFKELFKKEKLQEFIADMEKLKYDKETREESQRKEFISIFKEMLSFIETGKA